MESLLDYDVADEVAEEMGTNADAATQPEPPIDPAKLALEIAELEGYCALALQIGENAKGLTLVKALPRALDEIAMRRSGAEASVDGHPVPRRHRPVAGARRAADQRARATRGLGRPTGSAESKAERGGVA